MVRMSSLCTGEQYRAAREQKSLQPNLLSWLKAQSRSSFTLDEQAQNRAKPHWKPTRRNLPHRMKWIRRRRTHARKSLLSSSRLHQKTRCAIRCHAVTSLQMRKQCLPGLKSDRSSRPNHLSAAWAGDCRHWHWSLGFGRRSCLALGSYSDRYRRRYIGGSSCSHNPVARCSTRLCQRVECPRPEEPAGSPRVAYLFPRAARVIHLFASVGGRSIRISRFCGNPPGPFFVVS